MFLQTKRRSIFLQRWYKILLFLDILDGNIVYGDQHSAQSRGIVQKHRKPTFVMI